MTEWSYQVSTARYRDKDTGRFLPQATLTAIRDTFSEKVKAEMGKVTSGYTSGRLSPTEWQSAMRAQIKSGHVAAYTLGRGGKAQMTKSDYGRVGQALRQEYKALATFQSQLSGMTPEAIASRTSLYAETAIGGYERGRIVGLKAANVASLVWHTEADERVCELCAPMDGRTFPIDDAELPPLHPRCRCWMEPA